MIGLDEIRAWLDRHPGTRLELTRPPRDDGRTRYRAIVSAGGTVEAVGYGETPSESVEDAFARAAAEGVTP